jgi:hypothetical protein
MQVAAHILMKIVHYLSRIFVCLPKLCFQTKAKTKPDLHIVGSNRTGDQLWPPSSLLGFHSPGYQLHVVALQSTDSQALEGTRHKSIRSDSSRSQSVEPMERTSD